MTKRMILKKNLQSKKTENNPFLNCQKVFALMKLYSPIKKFTKKERTNSMKKLQ